MKRLIAAFLTSLIVIVFSTSAFAQQQMIPVSGIVYMEGEPLPGAHVRIKNLTSGGTVTDIDGAFSLEVPKDSTIIISFLGFIPEEFTITEERFIEVHLQEQLYEGEELVVVGYGTVRKSDLTGAVSSIDAGDIEAASVSSIDQGLQGKAAGVVITQTSGQPGAGSTIRIRGTSSINGNNEPLYVIDGIPVISDAGQMSVGTTSGPSMNPLSSINPSDIESVEVLKDASATAIYGARGANGVILVTTKQGSRKGTEVTLGYYTGFQQVSRKIPMLNARQLAELGNDAADNADVTRRIIYASPNNLGEGIDWQDQIFRTAPISNYQLSINGGDEDTRYTLSGNYFDQQGIIISSGFEKGNIRLNLDQDLSERITVGANLNLNRSTMDGVVTDAEAAIASSVTSWALEFNPGLPVYNEDGEYVYENNTSRPPVGNPVADARETEQLNKSTRFMGTAYANWNIWENLDLRSSVGMDAFLSEEFYFVPNFLKRAEASNGQAALGNTKGYTWLVENVLSYNTMIGADHSLNAILGHTLQKFENNFLYAATSDFEDNRLGYHSIQSGNEKTLSLSGTSAWQMQSVLSRINYTYRSKYLLTASARIDGSSKFGEGNKYGFFPSFSAAWRMNEEAFMEDIEQITSLKVRAGYGVVGNEGIPPYSSMGTLEVTEAYFGENEIAKGAGPATLANEGLKWETTGQFNAGVDLGLWDDRLSVTADYYIKHTTDLLLNAPVPYTSGFKFAYTNIGELKNEGFEIAISSHNLNRRLQWRTNLTFAHNSNEITKLTGEDDAGLVGQNILGINGWTRITEGRAIGTFYGYKSDGIVQLNEDLSQVPRFQSYAPTYGDRKYVDQNGDGIINEQDKVVIGNANPDFSFGMGNEFHYKNFSLNVFLQGVYGNEIVNFNRFTLESFDGTKNNSKVALNRWTPDNPTNKYPRANALPPSNALSDVQVEDGSYLRVQDITLSYNLPLKLMDKLNLELVRVYISAKNLYTLTDYSGYDPEVSRFANDNLSMGADYGSYPRSRMFIAGINISL
ncbi:SusC/RagA family TonB-linked outer membrane protein [Gracilimonas mengyeensis]|uniref:TonB-linked outer membrane protein, SusC/RagA family n=1 Tax=Gracilimonas mengyeensis TaxID=1302730 RepID=A0A521EYT2_9BACT|nr:TonB-dependent receptor [Gracilimonas mengyeensis]SMO89027.1 TonB-linked outer membrane protein, SusC/RagA family [Gracilimonas mengyeensis]